MSAPLATLFKRHGGFSFLEELFSQPGGSGSGPVTALIIAGTGSGKSTGLAEYFATQQSTKRTLIVVPGREAARKLYAFMNTVLPANSVAYNIGGYETEGPAEAPVRFVTAGWLMAKLNDSSYTWDNLILDEAHSGAADYYLLRKIARFQLLVEQKRQYNLIFCSATVSVGSFETEFKQLRVFNLDTASHYQNPVHYRDEELDPDFATALEQLVAVVMELQRKNPHGNKLVFVDGEHMCTDLAARLNNVFAADSRIEVWPLFGNLSREELRDALAPPAAGQVKILIATNLAESSMTFPGTSHIVCSGMQKTMYTDSRGRKELRIERCSKSSLLQQRGRGMRDAPKDPAGQPIAGYTVMMLTQRTYDRLPDESPREVDTSALHEPILALYGLGYNPEKLMSDLPRTRVYEDTEFLIKYGLLEREGKSLPRPTELGKHILRIPVDIPLARILYLGAKELLRLQQAELIWYLIFFIAQCAIDGSPYQISGRKREMSLQEWNLFREEFVRDHLTEYYGEDDFETGLSAHRRFAEHHAGRRQWDRSWMYREHFSGNWFRELYRNMNNLARSLITLDVRFPNVDGEYEYREIRAALWPVLTKFAFGAIYTKVNSRHPRAANSYNSETGDVYQLDRWAGINVAFNDYPPVLLSFCNRTILTRIGGRINLINTVIREPSPEEFLMLDD
jgi:HrpA-like RNA helicase